MTSSAVCSFSDQSQDSIEFDPGGVSVVSGCIANALLPPHSDLQLRSVSQGVKEVRREPPEIISTPVVPGSTSEQIPSRIGSGTER